LSPRAGRLGLQVEILSSLLVVMLAGLAIVAVVMGSLATRTVESSALERLRLGARHLERALAAGPGTLADLAAVASSLDSRTLGGRWRVLDAKGRELGRGAREGGLGREYADLLAAARGRREVVAGGGFPVSDLVVVVPVTTPRGETGALVGRVEAAELQHRLQPLFRSGAWVLGIAALVFVSFGSYLLRRRIVLRVQELSAASRRIADGDLASRLAVSGSDELAELASHFNDMAASLARQREALLEAQRSLSRSERLATTGRLAAGVAHEVGNPVAAILGYVEVALRREARRAASPEGPPPEAADSRLPLERIRDEALRIRSLVRELLDLARPREIALRPHAPRELLERAAERLRPQPLLQGIALVVEAEGEGELPSAETDAGRVEQVLVNLVENAAHALAKTEQPRIALRARHARAAPELRRRRTDWQQTARSAQRPEAVALEVIDNGPGIDADALPHVFDPFYTTKDPGQGTGLGLWNAHRLAELLGGRLEVESRPGRTCFSLILPRTDREAECRVDAS
jgi:signal transduction histidine kinase